MAARMRTALRDDGGAVAIIVAVLLVVFVLLAAIAIDLGYAFNVRRQLQTAADAGALAGAQQLGRSGDAAEAEAVARDYAARNAVAPADGLAVDGVSVGGNYVQVTTSKPFSRFFGKGLAGGSYVRATSRAKIGYVVGMRGITPWFLAVVEPGDVSVSLKGSNNWTSLEGSGSTWSGGWSPGVSPNVVTDTKKGTRTVTGALASVRIENKYGVPQVLDDASVVVAQPTDTPVTSVDLSSYVVTSGAPFAVTVHANARARGVPKVDLDGRSLGAPSQVMSESGGTAYTFTGSAPSLSGDVRSSFLGVSVGEGASGKYAINRAAVLVVAQPSYVFTDVRIKPSYFPGPSGSTFVTVGVLGPDGFMEGQSYVLKQASDGAQYGNFFAVDLEGGGAAGYRELVAQGSTSVVRVGQVVYTLPGNMVGPTRQGLSDRIGGDTYTYDSWVAAGRPNTPRLVYVPIMDWMERPTGRTRVIVNGFAAFFVEDMPPGNSGRVVGRFVSFVAPGIPGDVPDPPQNALRTVRLVSEGVSY